MKRDFRFFENWCARMCMRSVRRERNVDDTGLDILLADSGVAFYGESEDGIYGRWYRTGFAIDQGDKSWIASYNDYPATDFDLVSPAEGAKRRLDECMKHARDCLHETHNAGLYDHGQKHRFSQRPH